MENNRSLSDRTMNELDHALGRPSDVDSTTRNFFGVGCDSAEETAMLRQSILEPIAALRWHGWLFRFEGRQRGAAVVSGRKLDPAQSVGALHGMASPKTFRAKQGVKPNTINGSN